MTFTQVLSSLVFSYIAGKWLLKPYLLWLIDWFSPLVLGIESVAVCVVPSQVLFSWTLYPDLLLFTFLFIQDFANSQDFAYWPWPHASLDNFEIVVLLSQKEQIPGLQASIALESQFCLVQVDHALWKCLKGKQSNLMRCGEEPGTRCTRKDDRLN